MLIKFLDHGTGNAHAAARYLIGTHDHNGIERAEVKVLRGDPMAVAQVADSLDFKNRYTSGVIAFAPEDNPTDEQIKQVIDDFEGTAFAGLSRDRVAYSAILHREANGACHIHIFVARVDLKTSKSLNIASPGWDKSFDPLRDMHNHRHGWARPDDPARARTQQPGHVALIEAADLRRGMQVEPDPKALIAQYLEQRIEAGKVKDRADILEALKDAGFQINREGKDYISIKDAETGEKLRLKGAIYEQHFTPSRALEIADLSGAGIARKPNIRRADEARRELEAAISRRAEYNKKRYQVRERPAAEIYNKRQDASRGARQQAAPDALDRNAVARAVNDRSMRANRADCVAVPAHGAISSADSQQGDDRRKYLHSNRQPRLDDVRDQQEVIPLRTEGVNHGRSHDNPADRRQPPAAIAEMPRLSAVGSVHAASRPGQSLLQPDAPCQLRQPGERPDNRLQQVSATGAGVSHDRERTAVARLIEEVERGISAAREAFDRTIGVCREAIRCYDIELSNIAKANSELVAASKDIERGRAKMIENRADELEIFKTKISLTEYAEAAGFALDRRESSNNCHVMRSGSDKIVITRGKDGHDVYFNVKDERDNGSVVDFVQKRQSLNLGQVRKELRPWAGLKGPRVESVKRRKPEHERIDRPQPIERDRAEFIASFHRLEAYDGDYLDDVRKLKPGTIDAFAGVIRKDAKGNTCFLHRDQTGEVTGWEVKNRGFNGFSAGGNKALAMHMPDGEHVQRVVVVESMIDAMSYYQRHGEAGDLYISFAGGVSEAQAKQLHDIVKKSPAVLLATDNDEQGHKYAAMVQQWRPDAVRETPSHGKDWNDEVQHQARSRGISMGMSR